MGEVILPILAQLVSLELVQKLAYPLICKEVVGVGRVRDMVTELGRQDEQGCLGCWSPLQCSRSCLLPKRQVRRAVEGDGLFK